MAIVAVRGLLQKFFLAATVTFLVVLMFTVVIRSNTRRSVLSEGRITDSAAAFADLEETGTRIHLQDFHRVEVKDGRPVWEVRAKDAQYFAQERVTHINDSSVIVYRRDHSSVRINAASAKLYMTEESIERAELEGNVVVDLGESVTVTTDMAVYQARTRQIMAPGRVSIEGNGYEVKGARLSLDLDSQLVTLSERVTSRFAPRAELPVSLGAGSVL
jgi:LPS export ABC transporter protein LptC